MRKLKLFLSLLMVMLLSVGNVWAAEETVSWTASTGALGSAISSVNGTAQGTISTGTFSWNYKRTLVTLKSGKSDYVAMSGSYLQLGSSNAGESVELRTSAIPGTIKSVTMLLGSKDSRHTGSITVGGTDYNAGAIPAWANSAGDEWEGTGTSSGEIVISIDCNEKKSPIYIASITVVYEEGESTCTSEITITKADNPANGTFTLDESGTVCIDEGNATVNVTASPTLHYHLASVNSTVGTVGTISNNTCAITNISANTTISATFAEDDKVKVTWNVNGDETLKTDVYVGDKPVFPAKPTACDATSTTFIGWATAPWTGKLDDLSEKTVYTNASDMPAVNAAVTYYAVFAKVSGDASSLFSWAGGGKTDLLAIEGIVSSSLDADYANSHSPYLVKWNGDGKYLIIPVSAQPGKLSVGFKMIGGATTSTVDVQESTATDGEFTTVETLSISGSSNDIVNVETTKAFKSTTRAIKLLYHKGSNVGLGPISIEGVVSYEDYMTTCCTKHAVNIVEGIEHGSVSADPVSACEGATITLTFTPALNYHLSAWTLNGEAQDIAENTFTMPAAAVTVSATFAEDACTPLGTPSVAVSGKAYPYNAVKLAWSAIDNADAYKVYIYDNEDNELEHNDAFAGVEYTIGQTLSASTTYKYSVQAISNTPATYCPSTEAESTFTTDALPTAHLTLIALGEEHASSGDYAILTPFNLPATAAACSKAFVGWDADPDCATIPTYAKGAEFTFDNTTGVTLYAVYADETPGAATIKTDELDYEFTGLTGTSYKTWSGKTGTSGAVYAGQSCALGSNPSSTYIQLRTNNSNSGVVTTTTGAGKVTKVTVTWNATQGNDGIKLDVYGKNTAYSQATDLYGDNAGTLLGSIVKGTSTELAITGSYDYIGLRSNNGTVYLDEIDVQWTAQGASTYDNYSTTCVAAPTAEPASASIAVAAAAANSTLGVTYNNVNLDGVSVALFNDAACTIAFDREWLTATIEGDDKHIAYTIAENTAYAARTAYIKLTAPETSGAANPAVVVIPVEQAKKPAVFASLEDLVAAELASGTEVTVTFANEVITDDQYISQGTKRAGVFLTTKAANDKAIEIFYNKGTTVVPAEWLIGGKLAANAKTFTWTLFNDQWELVPLGNEWTWDNGDLTYTAPKAVSSVVVSGAPTKTSYVDGEKFNPAGLTVTVNYNIGEPDVIDAAGADWVYETSDVMALNQTSIKVKATYNTVTSENFYEVTDLTVNPITNKTIAQFIADEGGRCYLEGIVSGNINTTYGNFDLQDETGTIYVYGSDVFEDHGVALGDKVKVIAEEYLLYKKAGNPDKDEALNVKFVSVKKATIIAIEDINMEVGDELLLSNIVATVTPAAAQSAEIAYEVSEGSAVEIEEEVKIKAIAEGEATITASITEGEGYLAGSKTFTVTVTAPDTRKIANASAFEAISGDMTPADIAFASYKGDGTTDPIVKDKNIRLYKPASGKSTGGYLTLTAKVGCTIDQVQITFSGNADAAYCKDDEALPTEKYITSETVLLTPADLDAQSVSIVNLKNGSIDVNAIKVWYNGEPLPIDHYFLGGSYPTEFEQYGTFDYTGLQVFAAYNEQETIKEEIFDFTAEADLMTAGAKKAEVYRGENKIAEYDITVTESPKQNPALAYTPSEETITLGDAWSAPEFSNPLQVEGITFSSNKTAVAKVTSAGVITLEGGCGTAVITAHFEATDDYIESTATYTITVNEPAENLAGKWEIVKEVLPGMRIIIANEAAKTMGAQNSNNRAAVVSTVDGDDILTPANGTKTFLVVETETEGQYALRALNGNYIYAASSSSNHLKERSNINDNAKWSFSFAADGAATIKASGTSHNWIRYNSQSDIFSCYENGQEDVYVYAWKPYTRTVSGNYGTICLPNGGKMLNGALYEIAYYGETSKKIFFDEVADGVMVAGQPYIFKPNEGVTELKVLYTDAANVAEAGHKNGLYGHYDLNHPEEGAEAARKFLTNGDYFLRNNEYWLVDQENRVYVDNYRAYIKLNQINPSEPSLAPGRRRVAMTVHSEQTATGVDAINATDAPVKMMINGQMYILRGEKMYDATGRLVK